VYIRNVSRGSERSEAIGELAHEVVEQGSTLILADDTLSMARHAVEQGWIRPEALEEIAEEKARDEGPPGLIERLVGEGEGAPTVTVEGRERSRAREE